METVTQFFQKDILGLLRDENVLDMIHPEAQDELHDMPEKVADEALAIIRRFENQDYFDIFNALFGGLIRKNAQNTIRILNLVLDIMDGNPVFYYNDFGDLVKIEYTLNDVKLFAII
mgnify:CR=1 FL=1